MKVSELSNVYNYISDNAESVINDELYHHGVLGMRWGIRRYQPYSLIPRGSGKKGKEIGQAKKVKSNSSSSSSTKKSKKSRKQTQEVIKAKKVSELQTNKQRKEAAQKVLKSGDAKQIYENRDSFTTDQIKKAMERIDTEKQLRSLVAEQNPTKIKKVKTTLNKVVNSDNLQKTADMLEKGINLYNQTARIVNVTRDDEHKLKYVGKAENSKDKPLSKELKDILYSGDAQKILDNQSKFSDEQIKSAKQRSDNLANLKKQAEAAKKSSKEQSDKNRDETVKAVDTYGQKYAREVLARDYGKVNANKLVDSLLAERALDQLDSQAANRYSSTTSYQEAQDKNKRLGRY